MKVIQFLLLLNIFAVVVGVGFSNSGPSQCNSTQYYNVTTYQCLSCGIANSIATSDGMSCTCATGYSATYVLNMLTACSLCSPAGVVLPDNSSACTTVNSADTTNVTTANYFTCNALNYYLFYSSTNALDCQQCSYGQYALINQPYYQCNSCPFFRQIYQKINGVYTCSCTGDTDYSDISGTSTCGIIAEVKSFANIYPSIDFSVYFQNIDNTGSLTGTPLTIPLPGYDTLLKQTWFYCYYYTSNTECQELSNLCVLAYYSTTNPSCSAYLSVAQNLPPVDSVNYE